jgi:hypothetical protein
VRSDAEPLFNHGSIVRRSIELICKPGKRIFATTTMHVGAEEHSGLSFISFDRQIPSNGD